MHSLSADCATHPACNHSIAVTELDWGNPAASTLYGATGAAGAAQVDVIIGADLVYDPANHPALTDTLAFLFACHCGDGGRELLAYLACTVRTEATFSEFVDMAASKGMAVEVLSVGPAAGAASAKQCLHCVVDDDVTVRAVPAGEHEVRVVCVRRGKK